MDGSVFRALLKTGITERATSRLTEWAPSRLTESVTSRSRSGTVLSTSVTAVGRNQIGPFRVLIHLPILLARTAIFFVINSTN